MKKNDFIYPAIFLIIVVFLFIIPISAFLTSEIFELETGGSIAKSTYKFFEDHGGFIGSIAGTFVLVITVYFTITKQSENVRSQIEAQELLAKKNRFEDKKSQFLELLNDSFHSVSCVYNACMHEEERFDRRLVDLRNDFDLYRDKVRLIAQQYVFLSDDLFNEYLKYLVLYSILFRGDVESIDLIKNRIGEYHTLTDQALSEKVMKAIDDTCEKHGEHSPGGHWVCFVKSVLTATYSDFHDVKEKVVEGAISGHSSLENKCENP